MRTRLVVCLILSAVALVAAVDPAPPLRDLPLTTIYKDYLVQQAEYNEAFAELTRAFPPSLSLADKTRFVALLKKMSDTADASHNLAMEAFGRAAAASPK